MKKNKIIFTIIINVFCLLINFNINNIYCKEDKFTNKFKELYRPLEERNKKNYQIDQEIKDDQTDSKNLIYIVIGTIITIVIGIIIYYIYEYIFKNKGTTLISYANQPPRNDGLIIDNNQPPIEIPIESPIENSLINRDNQQPIEIPIESSIPSIKKTKEIKPSIFNNKLLTITIDLEDQKNQLQNFINNMENSNVFQSNGENKYTLDIPLLNKSYLDQYPKMTELITTLLNICFKAKNFKEVQNKYMNKKEDIKNSQYGDLYTLKEKRFANYCFSFIEMSGDPLSISIYKNSEDGSILQIFDISYHKINKTYSIKYSANSQLNIKIEYDIQQTEISKIYYYYNKGYEKNNFFLLKNDGSQSYHLKDVNHSKILENISLFYNEITVTNMFFQDLSKEQSD